MTGVRVVGKGRQRMEKRDWLLLSIGEGIKPIQLQMLLFKFAREASAPKREVYEFEPCNWGPCSFGLYDDLGVLRSVSLVEAIPTGRGWNRYQLTDAGRASAAALKGKADARLLTQLHDKYEWVTSRSFDKLLEGVYADYPEFTRKGGTT